MCQVLKFDTPTSTSHEPRAHKAPAVEPMKTFIGRTASLLSLVYLTTASTTKNVLDTFERLFEGGEEFDEQVYNRLISCLTNTPATPDVDFVAWSDRSWDIFIEYGRNGGNLEGTDLWAQGSGWIEDNPTPFSQDDNTTIPGATEILIQQPCNAVSNIAYYRAAIDVCEYEHWAIPEEYIEALTLTFSIQAYGSMFYHGGETTLGYLIDVIPTGAFAQMGHQAMFDSYPYNSILNDFSEEPATQTGIDIAIAVGRAFAEEDPANLVPLMRDVWNNDIYKFEITYAGTFTTLFNLGLPRVVASNFTRLVTGILVPVEQPFIMEKFLPALTQRLVDGGVRPSFQTRLSIALKGIGSVLKLFQAFFWQEQAIPGCHVYNPYANLLGARIMPKINRLANMLTGFDHSKDFDVQQCRDVYPGEERCRREQPHSKWHEASATGVADLLMTNNAAYKVLSGEQLPLGSEIGIAQCFIENHCLVDAELLLPSLSMAAETCIGFVTEAWPFPDTAGFFNCATSSLLYEDYNVEGLETTQTLDTCLIENKCIGFDGFGRLDVKLLSNCIGLRLFSFGGRAPCKNHINRLQALTCSLRCRGDRLCLLGCIHRTGDLSLTGHGVLGCVLAMAEPDGPKSTEYLEACRAAPVESGYPSRFIANLALTLPFISSCALEACLGLTLGFSEAASTVVSCAAECREDRAFGPLLYFFLPRSMACMIQCYLEIDIREIRDMIRSSPECPPE